MTRYHEDLSLAAVDVMPSRPSVRFSRHLVFVYAIGFLGCFLTACKQPPSIGADIAVSIHGEQIHYDAFEGYLRDNVDSADTALDSDVRSKLFDQFLDEQLLVRLAVERGMVEPGVEQRGAVEFLLRAVPRESWTETQVRAYYEAHQDAFSRSEEVHLRQILVAEREVVEQARDAIAAGEDFAQVAARFSQEPTSQLGGDQGRLAREDLPVAYADTIFDLSAGEVTEIITADYGFHLFQVVERYPAEVAPLEDVEAEIRQALESQRVDDIITGFIDEARERYNVIVFPSNVPFDYQGDYVPRDNGPDAH